MREVKYSKFIFLIISMLLLVGVFINSKDTEKISFVVAVDGTLQIQLGKEGEVVKAWEKEGVYYLFMPSYVRTDCVRYEDGTMEWDHIMVKADEIPWDKVCDLTLKNAVNETVTWQGKVCFMKSDNIPTLYVNVEDMNTLNSDKAARIPAEMTLIETDGSVNYQGELEYITGRGNTTWFLQKKTYALKLPEAYPLLNMDKNKKWVLLANGYEGSKVMYKMTMDIAEQMGIDYTPQMTWVDLYVNGIYQGNYLLSEKVMVDDGRVEIENLNVQNEIALSGETPETFVDNYYKGYETEKNPENITGGYLIEKDYPPYYSEEACGFITSRLQTFSIKHPSVATRGEVEYIWGFVNAIDNMMAERDENVLQFIDKESFYRKFILDEVALNSDSNVTSAYFYKKKNENILYAGPPWDYDGVYGESDGVWMDYTQTILDINLLRESDTLALDWYNVLYSFEECREELIMEYEKILPLYEYYLEEGIDAYKEEIYASVKMDMKRWQYNENQAGYYDDYENTIKYLKYFLANRLNWLNQRWEIDKKYDVPQSSNKLHNIDVIVENEIVSFQVKDGECISTDMLPDLANGYEGYVYQRDGQKFSEYLPVYENQSIIAVEKK